MPHTFEQLSLPILDTPPVQPVEAAVQGYVPQADRAIAAIRPKPVAPERYAGHIVQALNLLGSANEGAGMRHAMQIPQHQARIVARYGAHTDGIVAETDHNADQARNEARREFYRAHGLGRLAATTELSPAERVARRGMEDRWQSFIRRFGGTGVQVRTLRTERIASLNAAFFNDDPAA